MQDLLTRRKKPSFKTPSTCRSSGTSSSTGGAPCFYRRICGGQAAALSGEVFLNGEKIKVNLYHYAGNNPINYTDPDGKVVFLIGNNKTAGVGAAVSHEFGIALSIDDNGHYQIGTYQSTGAGFLGGYSASDTFNITIAPMAQTISDMNGKTETVGASKSFGVFTFGGDVNIPIDGPIKNFSISANLGINVPTLLPGEGHALTMTTTTKVYAEGDWSNFGEVLQAAEDAGLFKDISKADFIQELSKHFDDGYLNK
jgi:hypothetical protein